MTVTVGERPILFSGPMVRAILDGRLTQTRRVVKPRPTHVDHTGVYIMSYEQESGEMTVGFRRDIQSPYHVGDHLWVRERISRPYSLDVAHRNFTGFYYASDPDRKVKWIPSIHMPRWASRFTLEITDVRVERVQDISEGDAEAEGAPLADEGRLYPSGRACFRQSYRQGFSNLWDSINAKRGYGWTANPWVWAITFRRVEGTL